MNKLKEVWNSLHIIIQMGAAYIAILAVMWVAVTIFNYVFPAEEENNHNETR